MPSQNKNIIANLRGKHDPHYKLAARVDALEKDVRGISSIHVTLSKSFGMQRKTLIRVLALEKKVAELKSEVQAEEDIGDWADESGEWDTSGAATSTSGAATSTSGAVGTDGRYGSVGGETTDTRATGTLTAGASALAIRKPSIKDPGYASRVMGQDASGEYLSPAARKLAFKRRKISASAFKKGSSVGGAQKVAADTTGASALDIRKPSTSGGVASQDITPDEGGEESKGGGLMSPLKGLLETVKGIEVLFKQSNKEDVKARKDAQKEAEKKKRKKSESKLESITGPIGKAAEKVLAPAKSLFEKIFGFLMTIFAGNVAMRLFDWFGDAKNMDKIKYIFKFLSDWWPVLLAGVMAFMPALLGPGGFILGVVALLAWGIPKIIEAINWVKGLFGGGVSKELENLDKDAKKEGENLGATIEGETENDVNDILKEAPDAGDDLKQQPDELQNVPEQKEIKQPPDINEFNKGGVVPGSGNTDTVPAMLTPGEFVMSKGAVQRYGSGTLAGMNAAAGGTNRPTVGYHGGGTVKNVSNYMNGGGIVNNMSSTASAGNMLLNVPSITYPSTLKFSGGGEVPEQVVVNKEDKPKTLGGQIGKTLINFMKVFSPIPFVGGKLASMGKKLVGGVQEVIAEQHKGLHQSSEASAAVIAKSAPSVKPVKPPSKPTTTVAYDKQVKSATAAQNNAGPDMELPPFNPATMRSASKIRTLGITV